LYVDSNISFDLRNPFGPSTSYPPRIFPGYYYPNSASPLNPRGVVVSLYIKRPGWSNWYLMIKGNGDFSPYVKISQLLIAPSGTQPPQEGSPPSSPWLSLSQEYQLLNLGNTPIPNWRNFNKDFLFMTDNDDEAGNFNVIISFRFFGL